MVNLTRFLASFLASQAPLQLSHNESLPTRSVAIIGAGSAGLAMLKTLLDLPNSLRQGWEFVLFEEREDVGGVWLPNEYEVSPPEIPETPLYPLLHTNTPVPFMTYPGFPFPQGTPLYPNHTYVQAYHARYARHYNLVNYIRFNHKIRTVEWEGTSEKGHWKLTITDNESALVRRTFDHLVIASGNHHIPRIPQWKGQDVWLSGVRDRKAKRRIIHSVYYREPEDYRNQTVLVIGNGSSGRDIALQVAAVSNQTYISIRHEGETAEGVPVKPELSHFTPDGVVFVDGTLLDVDVVILATGYEQHKPFLERGGALGIDTSPRNSSNSDNLVSNLKYIFPLYRHILSLSAEYPTNALAFIGLPTYIANCPSDIAQSLFAAYAFTQPHILPPRSVLLQELAAQEDNVRAHGLDPYTNGHKMLDRAMASDYQDELVTFLQDKGVLAETGKNFVEQWRRDAFHYEYLRRGWKHIEELGEDDKWVRGVETEEQWAKLMWQVNEWQKEWEEANGVSFRVDLDLAG